MSKAGGYRHPISVQRIKASATPDAFGHLDRTNDSNWETYCSRRSKVKFGPGKEVQEGEQTQGTASAVFTIRRDATTMNITAAMRVVSYGQVWEIAGVNGDGDKQLDIVISATRRT